MSARPRPMGRPEGAAPTGGGAPGALRGDPTRRPEGAAPTGGGAPSARRGDHIPRRIFGIDPGLRVTGFGVVDAEGGRLTYVASGVIRTGSGSAPARLGVIARDLAHVLADYAPAEVVVERVFVNVNPSSTLLLGQARGAAIAAVVLAGLPVHEYTAGQIKQAVVGGGRAAKPQVQAMVVHLLGLAGLPSPDAADALAAAVCHAHATTGAGAIGGLVARRRPVRPTRLRLR